MVESGAAVSSGDLVRHFRLRRGLTVRACAELCGRTEEWLRQIESGTRPLDRIPTLILLARVLGLGHWTQLVPDAPAEKRQAVDSLGVLEHPALPKIRWLLNQGGMPPSDRAAVDVEQLHRRIDEAWCVWHGSKRQYTALGAVLPGLLSDAFGLRGAGDGTDRVYWASLAKVYHLAQRFLYCIGELELATRVADRSLMAAQMADDPFLVVMSFWCMAMVDLRAGRLDEAVDVASAVVDGLHSRVPLDRPDELSLCGSLNLLAATGSALLGQKGTAWWFWDKASEAARLLGERHHNPWTMFGQANVEIYAVAIDMESGKAKDALTRATVIAPTAIPSSNCRVHYLIDVAHDLLRIHDYAGSFGVLLDSHEQSAEAVIYSAVARETVGELLRHERGRVNEPLHELARHVNIVP